MPVTDEKRFIVRLITTAKTPTAKQMGDDLLARIIRDTETLPGWIVSVESVNMMRKGLV